MLRKCQNLNGKKNKFAMWSVKIKAYLAMKFLGPTLLVSFKDSLPAYEQVESYLNKPNKLAKNRCKAINLHMTNLKQSDQVAKAEQGAKLLSLKLRKEGDPSKLELKIASTEDIYIWNSAEQGNEDCRIIP